MGSAILVFIGSLAGVLLLILFAAWLRLGGKATLSDELEARELADNAICGFTADEVALDTAGRGALLRECDGRILLLAPHGVHFAARLLDESTRVSRDGGALSIKPGESTFPAARLDLGEKADIWDKRLSAL